MVWEKCPEFVLGRYFYAIVNSLFLGSGLCVK